MGEDYQKHGQRNTGGRRKRQRGAEINGEKLADTLGTKVQIEMAGGRGTISINFFPTEELNAFINKMMAEVDKKVGTEQKAAVGSIDGIIENKSAESAPVGNELSAEKNDFSGAATVDPVEELLKIFRCKIIESQNNIISLGSHNFLHHKSISIF